MPALQVRDFPAALYDDLKLCAERDHRSISQQVVVAVESMLRGAINSGTPAVSAQADTAERINKRSALFRDIQDLNSATHLPEDLPDVVQLMKEERALREQQILATSGFKNKGKKS